MQAQAQLSHIDGDPNSDGEDILTFEDTDANGYFDIPTGIARAYATANGFTPAIKSVYSDDTGVYVTLKTKHEGNWTYHTEGR
jgi:hypothetical protein